MKIKITKKKGLYYTFQILGWFLFALVSAIQSRLNGSSIDGKAVVVFLWVWINGILITHLIRFFIIRFHLLSQNIFKTLFGNILLSLLGGFLFVISYHFIENIIFQRPFIFDMAEEFQFLLNWSLLILFWQTIYFSYNFFLSLRNREIENLELQNALIENELNILKNQLNPHFIFNSMNSIKALISENPEKAKENIVKLSGLLRKTIQQGKKRLIPFEEELQTVEDYLELEKTRFEEKLRYSFNIDDKAYEFSIPPLMLQTLVENAIKHGISKNANGGEVRIIAKVFRNSLKITIINTGQYNPDKKSVGIGVKNTKKRLKLIFENQASITIRNFDEQNVITNLIIPKI
ncbi:MAG: histidine kinase [Bacteroidetes bacterium]|nr:MAG: histidine kinase [Bacteroidota bacterium]